MPKSQKLFHVSMIVDASVLYDITAISAKRSFNLQIEPVIDARGSKANGHDPDAARVPTWVVLRPFWLKHKQFRMKDAMAFAFANGVNTKGAVYTAVLAAEKQGWLKRSAPGTYNVLPALKKASDAAAKGTA